MKTLAKPRVHYTSITREQMLNGGYAEGISVDGFVESLEQFVEASREMTDEAQEME